VVEPHRKQGSKAYCDSVREKRGTMEGFHYRKVSGKDEPIWVVIHMCMEAMLGISLYSYPISNYQKHYVFLIIAYIFSSTKLVKRAHG
jgi:hypothetical protein